MQLKATYLFLIVGFLFQTTFAQDATLTATVSKNKLGVNQRLRIEFAVNKKGADNFKTPKF